MGEDLKVQRSSLPIPDPVVVGRHDLELIAAPSEASVDCAVGGDRFDPLRIEPVEAIPVTDLGRNKETKACKFDLDALYAGGEDRIRAEAYGFSINGQLLDVHRGRQRIFANAIWHDAYQADHSGQPERSADLD